MNQLSILFPMFLRIGLLSFGGPAAQIALMQTELVDRHKVITQERFLRALSFCMLLPGPEAMQLCTYIGWQRAGVLGGLMAGLLFVIPGAIFIAIMAAIYVTFGNVPYVQAAFVAIQAVVVLVVIQALIRLCGRAFRGRADIVIALLAFVALFFFKVPFPIIVLLALGYGALQVSVTETTDEPAARLQFGWTPVIFAAAWLIPLGLLVVLSDGFYAQIAAFFSKLAVVSFGGAYAVLAYMTQTVVQDHGWVTTPQMIDALGLAETTPGPLILVTQFVAMLAGFGHGGWMAMMLAGLLALYMTFMPCFLWIFAFGPVLDRMMNAPRIRSALASVTAAIVGVIANLSIWFALHVFFGQQTVYTLGPVNALGPNLLTIQWLPVTFAVCAAIALFRFKVSLPLLILISAVAGAIVQMIPF